ncbi:uncharacterized protein LOC103708116 [Phoenix dactylifera]|uniref:Uncharacterized protein LOC103708116 n=1 Tax=Phoenix dactylifera TaxID=42345 RepID=A0A8B8ZRT3_PHODC|nr:uncharacterized protein LOC103708116 [Phoenix dactylifera]
MSLGDDMDAERGSPNAIDSPPSICQPTGVGTSTATIGKKKGSLVSKKRKHNDTIIENLVTEMGKISSACEGSKEDFKKIANFFEKKGQSDERRVALFEEIMKIEDLSEDDMLIAGEVISKDKSKIDFFFTLPQQFKERYVLKQLEGGPYRPSFDFDPV